MKQKKILAYILGGFSAAVALVISVFLILIISEQMFPRQTRLVISTGSAEQIYNGEELRCEKYEIALGELREGDEITVGFTGTQTLVGVSDNTATVEIRDKNGVDVTDRYAIEFVHGNLTVDPRRIFVASADGEQIYNGRALTSAGCGLFSGELVDGHYIDVRTTGSQTVVGKSLNRVEAKVYDEDGNEVTAQYEIQYTLGTLTVTPRKIAIMSGSATKKYDGTPLTSSAWNFEAGSLCSGQSITVKTAGSQTTVGESENVIVHVLIYEMENGVQKDVTNNYEIACYYGTLSVSVPR